MLFWKNIGHFPALVFVVWLGSFNSYGFVCGEVYDTKANLIRMNDLVWQTPALFEWQIQKDIQDGNLMQALRLAKYRGHADLAYRIEQVLKDVLEKEFFQILESNLIQEGSTVAYLVEFRSGVKAVFKPETQAWEGRVKDDVAGHRNDPIAEVAAYQLSRIMGLDSIPMTVLREVNGMKGSLQAYVTHGRPPREKFNQWHPLLVSEMADLYVFNYILRNYDFSDVNIIFNGNKIWGIDHGASFKVEGDPWGQTVYFPRQWVGKTSLAFSETLMSTTPEMIRQSLREVLEPKQIEEVIQRHSNILRFISSKASLN